jgi:hypothetical protein
VTKLFSKKNPGSTIICTGVPFRKTVCFPSTKLVCFVFSGRQISQGHNHNPMQYSFTGTIESDTASVTKQQMQEGGRETCNTGTRNSIISNSRHNSNISNKNGSGRLYQINSPRSPITESTTARVGGVQPIPPILTLNQNQNKMRKKNSHGQKILLSVKTEHRETRTETDPYLSSILGKCFFKV